eukprot:TRINITY_DN1628_c0_g1_i1.p1 TRINITY_DN1628_c0_g1~~TRINITY_DN1628_c0_g1_i1.p1  ORF type:complete len:496 (-),score=239.51 TRINITY_DN1628_c0_g1_i1:759-2192(-)
MTDKGERQWKEQIVCVGAGYVGGPTMAVIAKHCPDVKVTVVDIDQRRIDAWNSRELPVFENGLQQVIDDAKATNNNLFFTTEIDDAIRASTIIFIAVSTPTKTYGRGAGKAFDMTYWDAVARNIAAVAENDKIIVEKSTVPVRTADSVMRILNNNKRSPHIRFSVVSNPEFLAEGTAIADLERPDRVLVGGNHIDDGEDTWTLVDKSAIDRVCDVYAHWVPRDRIVRTNLWSSELAKLVSNAFLAQRISSINAVSQMCEETGAKVEDIGSVLGMDKRIGSRYLKASVGFGGSCLKKDVLSLVYIAQYYQLTDVAEYWNHIVTINEQQKLRFAERILHNMYDSVRRKKIAVLGFAFKKDTGDTRETCAREVIKFLLDEEADVHVYDPQVEHHEMKSFFERPITCSANAYDAVDGAHACVVLTEWDEFKELDFARVYENMKKPAFVFDGRNILPYEQLEEIGFKMFAIGRRSKSRRIGF